MLYANKDTTKLNLAKMVQDGQDRSPESFIQSARFLHSELPIRLAKRIVELDSLPYGLSYTPPVIKVRGWYEQSFRDILSTREPTNIVEEEVFTRVIENILQRHVDVVPTLAQVRILLAAG